MKDRKRSVTERRLGSPVTYEGGRWAPLKPAKDDDMTRSTTSSRRETEWLGIPELARMLSVSEDLIRTQVHQRRIPYYKVGKLIRFDPQEVADWLSGLRVDPL